MSSEGYKYKEHTFESNGIQVRTCAYAKGQACLYVSLKEAYGYGTTNETRINMSIDQANDLIKCLNQAKQFANE